MLALASPMSAVLVSVAVAALLASANRVVGRAAGWIAMLGPLAVVVAGAGAASGSGASVRVAWFVQGPVSLPLGWAADGLACVMLLVVGVVALMVMLFSIGYMASEQGRARYFATLALFTASMASLVTATTLVTLLLSWELVGACSYMLIGYWYSKPSAADAALKAFVVTHVGDAGMLLGLALLWTATGTLTISDVLGRAGILRPDVATVSALLLFLAAAGKSAQFPLHFWLPDAMEGPTPVSALIHAATMVAAGVFLVARMWPLFSASPTALSVILGIGAFTALAAATIAVPQTDIKKVLAYSTISQLGFMFAALGAGAWPAAIFHLTTHGAFKALLFLAAGSAIHGAGTQELAEMGGLVRRMPVTAVTWTVGALSLAGIPPLAGFFSKDAVLGAVFAASPVAGVALVLASLLTAFYITRATCLAFFGEERGSGHAHESGLVMTVPLVVLAAGAAGLGPASGPIAAALGVEAERLQPAIAAVAVSVAALGILAGLRYVRGPKADEALSARLGGMWPLVRDGYGFDAGVLRGIGAPALAFAGWLYEAVDRARIDAFVEWIGTGSRGAGDALADGLENGDGQWYAALIGAGVVVLLALSVLLGRR